MVSVDQILPEQDIYDVIGLQINNDLVIHSHINIQDEQLVIDDMHLLPNLDLSSSSGYMSAGYVSMQSSPVEHRLSIIIS
jgi:hypothetical protein